LLTNSHARWSIARLTTRRKTVKTQVLASLTGREGQVHKLILLGKQNKQIAIDLSITVRTVRFHSSNILKKHECGSRLELVALALTSLLEHANQGQRWERHPALGAAE
jgi:DNA-binding NarL/FixJ family response regulator